MSIDLTAQPGKQAAQTASGPRAWRPSAAAVRAFFVHWSWLGLLGLAPLFVFARAETTPVLLAVPLCLVAGRLARPRTPLDWPVLGLAVMVLVSLWATFSIAFSLVKVAGMVLGIGLFYAAVAAGTHGRTARVLAQVLAVYLLLGAGMAGLALLGSRWVDKLPLMAGVVGRLPTGLVSLPGAEAGLHPNEVAGVLLWVAPLAVALAAAAAWHWRALAERIGRGWAVGVVVALAGLALLTTGVLGLTQSRSGLAGLAAGLITLLLLAGRWPRRLTLGVLALGLLVGGWLFAGKLRALYDYAVFATATTAWPGRVFAGLNGRMEIWSRAAYAIGDFAFTGMGMNTFREVVHWLYPLSLLGPESDFAHAHNTWLQVALDLGLPGLVAYVALWLGVIRLLRDVVRPGQPPALRAVGVGVAGCLAAAFGYGLTDTVALGARPGFMWWLLLAMAVLAWQRAQAATQMDTTIQAKDRG